MFTFLSSYGYFFFQIVLAMYNVPKDCKILKYCTEINVIVKIGKAEKIGHFRFRQIKPLPIYLVGSTPLKKSRPALFCKFSAFSYQMHTKKFGIK